jgi:hypothetical protein
MLVKGAFGHLDAGFALLKEIWGCKEVGIFRHDIIYGNLGYFLILFTWKGLFWVF